MKNCTCNKLNCDSTCLCACHRDKTEHELDLIKIDNGLKELVPEIFPELKELNNGLGRIEDAIDLCIERMQKYDLKIFRKKT